MALFNRSSNVSNGLVLFTLDHPLGPRFEVSIGPGVWLFTIGQPWWPRLDVSIGPVCSFQSISFCNTSVRFASLVSCLIFRSGGPPQLRGHSGSVPLARDTMSTVAWLAKSIAEPTAESIAEAFTESIVEPLSPSASRRSNSSYDGCGRDCSIDLEHHTEPLADSGCCDLRFCRTETKNKIPGPAKAAEKAEDKQQEADATAKEEADATATEEADAKAKKGNDEAFAVAMACMTTVVLRNLPQPLTTTTLAEALMPWHPNFVMVVPDFEMCASGKVAGYAFVNFHNELGAQRCIQDWNGLPGISGLSCWPRQPVNAVYAKTQGFDECCKHCRKRLSMVTMRPWIHPAHADREGASFIMKPRRRAQSPGEPGPSVQPLPLFAPGPLNAMSDRPTTEIKKKPSEQKMEMKKLSEQPTTEMKKPSEQLTTEMKKPPEQPKEMKKPSEQPKEMKKLSEDVSSEQPKEMKKPSESEQPMEMKMLSEQPMERQESQGRGLAHCEHQAGPGQGLDPPPSPQVERVAQVARCFLRCVNPLCELKVGASEAMGGFCCKRCAQVYDETGGDKDLAERWSKWHGTGCEHVPATVGMRRAYGMPFPEMPCEQPYKKRAGYDTYEFFGQDATAKDKDEAVAKAQAKNKEADAKSKEEAGVVCDQSTPAILHPHRL